MSEPSPSDTQPNNNPAPLEPVDPQPADQLLEQNHQEAEQEPHPTEPVESAPVEESEHHGEPVIEKHPEEDQLNEKPKDDEHRLDEAEIPPNAPDDNQECQEVQTNTQTDDHKKSSAKLSSSQKSQKQKQLETLERKKKLSEEQNGDNLLAEEALKASRIVLGVECCVLCAEHQYCTHHKEEKYVDYMRQLKTEIERLNPQIHVCKNYKTPKPQLGALEVVYNGVKVYSKLAEMKWPNATLVAKKLKALIEKEKEDKIKAETEALIKAEEERRKAEAEVERRRAAKEDEVERRNEEEVMADNKMDTEAPEEQPRETADEPIDKENNDPDAFANPKMENTSKFTEDNRDATEVSRAENVLGERDLNQEEVN